MKPFPHTYTSIGDGVSFGSIPMEKFQSSLIAVSLIVPLSKETVTENALVALMLGRSTADYPTYRLFSCQLNRLYGAVAGSSLQKLGDEESLTFAASTIDSGLALHGEDLLMESARLVLSMILHPLIQDGAFAEETFRLQKKYLADSIRAEINEKRRYAVNQTMRLMLGDEPAGLPLYGFLEDLEKITPQSAAAAYARILRECRIEIVHAGTGDASRIRPLFEEAFGGRFAEGRTPCVRPPFHHIPAPGPVKTATDDFEVVQSKLCIGYRVDITPGGEELSAMRMMVAILGGTATSKLFLNVREKQSLCYYCGANLDRTKGIVLIDSGVRPDNAEAAKAAIFHEVEAMQKGDFTDEDMRFALLSLQNTFRSVEDGLFTIESYYRAQKVFGIRETPEDQCRKLAAVTREDIIKAANMLRLDTVYLLNGTASEGEADEEGEEVPYDG